MDKRVDKSEDFRKSGMTLITEIDSERYLKKASKMKDVKEGRWFLTIKRSGRTDSAVSDK